MPYHPDGDEWQLKVSVALSCRQRGAPHLLLTCRASGVGQGWAGGVIWKDTEPTVRSQRAAHGEGLPCSDAVPG